MLFSSVDFSKLLIAKCCAENNYTMNNEAYCLYYSLILLTIMTVMSPQSMNVDFTDHDRCLTFEGHLPLPSESCRVPPRNTGS